MPLWHGRDTEASNRRAQFSLAHVVKITRVGKKAREYDGPICFEGQ
jgi:hypothetical protein